MFLVPVCPEIPEMPLYKQNHTFTNWAHTLKFKPELFGNPETEEEVIRVVKDAIASGRILRTHGGTHSWSDIVVTDGILINLDKLNAGRADIPNRRYTVQAGIRLKDLIRNLASEGLALKNIGSVTEQSIAGAISTGTHGTGLRLQNMSQSIVEMKLVTGTGDLLKITGADRDLLDAARVSIGALGIITEVTIECVPLYDLEHTVYWCKFNDVIDKIDVLNEENERFLIWWLVAPFGSKEDVIVVTNNSLQTPPGILSGAEIMAGNFVDRDPLPMDTNDVMSFLMHLLPSQPFQQILKHRGRYDKVLTIPLLPVFHRECEYAIPAEHTSAALRRLKRVIQECDISTTLPVEVRFVARDTSLLSPARGKDVCYIGVATQPNANEVYARFEPIMKDFGGRPHWGKHFSLRRSEVAAMYSDSYDAFREIRQRLDPQGIFGNTLLRELFDF